jgi:hypothetical protein
MFVITADQVHSRRRDDAAGSTRDRINREHGPALVLPADRNAGDEIQMLSEDPATTLHLVLELTRDREWSVGLGSGDVRLPLPEATREASGTAFFAARDAVNEAKKRQTRFAVKAQHLGDPELTESATASAANIEALIDLLLVIRRRRTPPGWELYDLVKQGMTQQDAAARLSISPPAASARASAANIRIEQAAVPALTKLLHDLQSSLTGTDRRT